MGEPHWTQIVSPLLGVVVAAVVALIGYLSWRTAERQKEVAELKVKMDLFDRRYALYSSVRGFLNWIIAKDFCVDPEEFHRRYYQELFGQAKLSFFLFDQDVEHYLTDIRNLVLEANESKQMIKPGGSEDDRKRHISRYYKSIQELGERGDHLRIKLAPFLALRERGESAWLERSKDFWLGIKPR